MMLKDKSLLTETPCFIYFLCFGFWSVRNNNLQNINTASSCIGAICRVQSKHMGSCGWQHYTHVRTCSNVLRAYTCTCLNVSLSAVEYDRIPRYYPPAGPAGFPLKRNLTTSCGVNSLQQAFFGGLHSSDMAFIFEHLKTLQAPTKKVSLQVRSYYTTVNRPAKPLKVLRAVV